MALILTVAAVLLFLHAASIASVLGRAMHAELRPATGDLADVDEVPTALRDALLTAAGPLEPLGFRFSHTERRVDGAVAVTHPAWVLLYHHAEERAWAEVTAARVPSAGTPIAVTFVTLHTGHRTTTLPFGEKRLDERLDGFSTHASPAPGLDVQWRTHRRAAGRVEADDATVSAPGDRDPTAAPEAIVARRNRDESRQHTLLRDAGAFVATGTNEASTDRSRLHWTRALALLRNRDGAEKPEEKVPSESTASSPTPTLTTSAMLAIEADAFTRRDQFEREVTTSPGFRLGLLITSAIACTGFLGWILSFELALLLIPVLLLHELGHYLAMVAFGYRHRFVVFMPLGALAGGEKDDASTLARAVVLLAGPVPGILLGFALLAFLPEIGSTTFALIVMLIGLNALNLLPILPLDGGRLLELALPTRHAGPRLALQWLSVALAGTAAFSFGDPFLAVLAVWLLLGIVQGRTTRRLVREHDRPNGAFDRTASAARLLDALRTRRGSFEARFQHTRQALSMLQAPSVGIGGSVALLALHGLCLIGPYVLFAENVGGLQTRLIAGGVEWATTAMLER